MDVVALAQAGIAEAVAPLGTALTEAQLERLWRLADVPILCLDGDTAGQKAALRAAKRALPLLQPGKSLAFATLPAGQDPDDLARSGGAAAIEKVLTESEPLIERIWAAERDTAPITTPEERAGLGVRLRTMAGEIKDRDVRENYLAAFNQRIYDLFHPERPSSMFKRFDRKPDLRRPVSERLLEISKHGIAEVTYVPALIKGLLRYPDLIAPMAELLVRIPIKSKRLRQTREVMLITALQNVDLDPAIAERALREDGQAAVLSRLADIGIGFSFVRAGSDEMTARRDLQLVVEILATTPELDADLASARAKAAEGSASDFDVLARLVREKHEHDQAFQNTLHPDDLALA